MSAAGVCSRREAETLITGGHVKVNGDVVTKLGTRVLREDLVTVNGRGIKAERRRLFLFHKPRRVVTSLSDDRGRRDVSSFIEELQVRVFPVGRLDRDVNGLVVLTNDGEFANQMLHPSNDVTRVYLAIVTGIPDEATFLKMTKGIFLEDGKARADRAMRIPESEVTRRMLREVRPGEAILRVEVSEGRNHFVKRLLARLGLPVKRLCRIEFGPFRLGQLKPGEVVELKEFPTSLKRSE
ncbi:MAG: rRNA pseudouridine synthase [Deltaproteobacteria bacterium]|nr:rRNA pseudouridine synthase [Deltaproteobacteria bacterium]